MVNGFTSERKDTSTTLFSTLYRVCRVKVSMHNILKVLVGGINPQFGDTKSLDISRPWSSSAYGLKDQETQLSG
jgi:hypothetical protein